MCPSCNSTYILWLQAEEEDVSDVEYVMEEEMEEELSDLEV